ncbi:hypothetical protein J2X65_003178 [Ancylobacter sp. 3268]|uniref:hypothetical protein n=1 Tax=Ancylobacter sp. 3268 TaxID=2817752 RepID=UPI00285DE02D|nr:hypothetical protein [Ancylobacter sp. 3268]MDR6953815.1 hypothetical protein [Ancylobacter sp. 3268]
MDDALTEMMARDMTFVAASRELSARFQRISPCAVADRARRLGLAFDPMDAGRTAVNCQQAGTDRLLAALRSEHRCPPPDIRPHILDRARFDWRRQMAGPSGISSPAACCLEG